MSQLILSCVKTGRAFKSSFSADREDLRFVPPKWTARFLCGICRHVHEFEFAQAQLCDCPHHCPQWGLSSLRAPSLVEPFGRCERQRFQSCSASRFTAGDFGLLSFAT
jgi:hypothetical protein